MRFLPIQNAFTTCEPGLAGTSYRSREEAHRAWRCAIAAMGRFLSPWLHDYASARASEVSSSVDNFRGLVLSGPTPVLHHPAILAHVQTCLWLPKQWSLHRPLLPTSTLEMPVDAALDYTVPLDSGDRLLLEQFCMVLTADFVWTATLSPSPDGRTYFCAFSFAPETAHQVLAVLLSRVSAHRPNLLHPLQQWLERFPPQAPDYRIPMQFSQWILKQATLTQEPSMVVDLEGRAAVLPLRRQGRGGEMDPARARSPKDLASGSVAPGQWPGRTGSQRSLPKSPGDPGSVDLELLQAIAHEVRTPLATIQTLTRLLLRRKDLPPEVIKRLEAIRRECVDQIDRFSLFFRAIELTTSPAASLDTSLTSISLQQILEEKIDRWKTLLENRSLNFQVDIPEDLPAIAIRDPNMLDQVLTGLIERLSHTLPLGSQIYLLVSLAGDQLKLQLRSCLPPDASPCGSAHQGKSLLKAVGQLLMFQPETGGLSLSLPATKQIFNFLGGKLTVRQSLPQGEIMTMFLPLDPWESQVASSI
ncbi:sensor histidine kinase [Lyngbya confervoides]|uniref:histidine kinase n=1 Tax=Lyngbya confervoides BDU141951 TaxID=1574623 RepID=A0ABD4T2K6_9CYAN|nr:HAMP domain-containing sensor histidine kinase [Lyngbya confervoides]MCM1982648.1 HAMP domain-containing histidine kinase [Lyngbya confervoides BDU141951]